MRRERARLDAGGEHVNHEHQIVFHRSPFPFLRDMTLFGKRDPHNGQNSYWPYTRLTKAWNTPPSLQHGATTQIATSLTLSHGYGPQLSVISWGE
jgi:hypothetical protein